MLSVKPLDCCYSGMSMLTSTNRRYLRLVITQDSTHDDMTLCVDDYEACSFWASPCPKTVSYVRRNHSKFNCVSTTTNVK